MSISGRRIRSIFLSHVSIFSLKRNRLQLGIPAVLVAMGCSGLPELPLDGLPLNPVSSFVEPNPAVTTSIRDARTEVPFLDGFRGADPVSLASLPRGPNNGFLLPGPGSYALSTQSYCLHAGTYGPTDGDGYIYAPLLGPRAALIQRLAQNSVEHLEISQRDVQTLIWAIQAHARLYDAPLEVQRTAAALLSEDDLQSLDDAAMSILAGAARDQAYAHLPQAARRVLQAEDDLRGLLTGGRSTYEELERTAVLVGVPPREDHDRDVPRGRWSYHPDGFFIRYFPSEYARTEVHVYWPEEMMFERDGTGRIAAVADFRGNRVEVEYGHSSASTVPTASSAYAFQ